MSTAYRNSGTYRSPVIYGGSVVTSDLLYDALALYDDGFLYDGPDGIAGSLFMFTPPNVDDVPPFLPETRGPARNLFRHYRLRTRGVNVFVLSDESVVQDTATAENSNTNIPYPWDPNDPSGPYARVYDIFGNETDFSQNPYITAVFYGAHSYLVNSAMATILTMAGYGDLLVPS